MDLMNLMKQFFERALGHCLAVTREQPHKVKPSREGTFAAFHLFHTNFAHISLMKTGKHWKADQKQLR
jgi:hypothetical protein